MKKGCPFPSKTLLFLRIKFRQYPRNICNNIHEQIYHLHKKLFISKIQFYLPISASNINNKYITINKKSNISCQDPIEKGDVGRCEIFDIVNNERIFILPFLRITIKY